MMQLVAEQPVASETRPGTASETRPGTASEMRSGIAPETHPGTVGEVERFVTKQIRAPEALNEAYDYGSSFSRGLRVELPGASMILISGTASVDECGESVHTGDIEAQCWRTFRNIEALLASEGADWHDIVRTTIYLRDMSRDYAALNQVRTAFYAEKGLDPLPASTCIQATICREDLLVEIEAIAMVPSSRRDTPLSSRMR